jgi:hypothetical protein
MPVAIRLVAPNPSSGSIYGKAKQRVLQEMFAPRESFTFLFRSPTIGASNA